jgi:hypothetical protein
MNQCHHPASVEEPRFAPEQETSGTYLELESAP